MHQFNLRVRVNVMNFLKNDEVIKDNGESRIELERRQFSYTSYIPERTRKAGLRTLPSVRDSYLYSKTIIFVTFL